MFQMYSYLPFPAGKKKELCKARSEGKGPHGLRT